MDRISTNTLENPEIKNINRLKERDGGIVTNNDNDPDLSIQVFRLGRKSNPTP
jgi:hypothetical protein